MGRAAGLLCAMALLGLPSSASAARSDCFPRGASTVAHSDSGRVYMYGDEAGAVACLYRSGIKRELTTDDFSRESLGPWAIAGRFVAYSGRAGTDNGGAYHNIYAVDIKTGEVVHEVSNTGETCEYSRVAAGSNCGSMDVRAIVVKRNGSTAWLTAHSPRAVWRLDGRGFRRLDRATGIDVRSLRLNAERTRISWVNNQRRRSAILR